MRKSVYVTAMVLTAISLTACGGGKGPDNGSSGTVAESTQAVTVDLEKVHQAVKEAYGENYIPSAPYDAQALNDIFGVPEDLYEAARVDGANSFQTFFKITLPYMLYITTPYLITTFTGNVNNFNVIYLLSSGDPVTDLASTAGKTDLLVTWLYKLTIDKQYYNIGAVIGILTFIILAVGALFTYRNSKSYKEEEAF